MRLKRIIYTAGALAAILLGACSDVLSPLFLNGAILTGTWTEENEVPGSSETWNLSVNGSQVTGNGTWSGEACCGGTVDITGHVQGDSLYLALKRTGSPFVPPTQVTNLVAFLHSPTEMGVFVASDRSAGEFRMKKQR